MIAKLALTVVTVVTLAPVANASTETASAKACARAFAATLAAPGAAAPAFKFAYRSSTSGSVLDFYSNEYTFTLEAHDPKTGATVTRAQCSTDNKGGVTSIVALPPAVTPVLAAGS